MTGAQELLGLAERAEAGQVGNALWFDIADACDMQTPCGNPLTSLDAATSTLQPGWLYRSGNDGAGPDPSRFFCEIITDAPDCHRVRAVADTEPLARTAASLRALAQTRGDDRG